MNILSDKFFYNISFFWLKVQTVRAYFQPFTYLNLIFNVLALIFFQTLTFKEESYWIPVEKQVAIDHWKKS